MNSLPLLPPALILLLGAALVPLIRGRAKLPFLLVVPILGLWNMWSLSEGSHFQVTFLEWTLTFARVDAMARLFGTVFHVVALLGALYLWNFRRDFEFSSGLFYAGAAVGLVFAGDWLSFFAFWELLTLGALGPILSGDSRRAYGAAFRYALFHVLGGLALLAGILLHLSDAGTAEMSALSLNTTGAWLILLGMGVNAAFPFLHAWLVDAYPAASIGGAVFLAGITTKAAVYALWRTFPGAEILIVVGAVMALFPLFYAVTVNDMRRLLSYIIINQVGFMVVGVGLGSELALNGVAAHAFSHILYDAVLFMAAGAVLYRAGTAEISDLGGLFRSMPVTAVFCMVGAASISAAPFTNGFISKSMVISAAGGAGVAWLWLVLTAASAGVFLTAGIRLTLSVFFGPENKAVTGKIVEAPWNMLAGMGIASFLCLLHGMFPSLLYRFLPFSYVYKPYTADHLVTQMQLLFFSGLAAVLLYRWGFYRERGRSDYLDADWIYRRAGIRINSALWNFVLAPVIGAARTVSLLLGRLLSAAVGGTLRYLLEGLWQVAGLPDASRNRRRADIRENLRKFGMPVGLTGGISLILIILLYVL